MQDGIAFNGEIITGGGSVEDESFNVEIPDDDPNFLVRAANKNSPTALEKINAMMGGFIGGAYSWPFDYTLCIHWILGSTGFYGPRVQKNCIYHRERILEILGAGANVIYYLIFRGILWKILNNETAQNIIVDQLGRSGIESFGDILDRAIPKSETGAQIAGRYASGKFFTRWMQSRVRRRGGGNFKVGSVGWLNFVMLSWGSAIHASHNHPTEFGLIEIFIAWITGDSNHKIDSEVYVAVFKAAQEISTNAEFIDNLGDDYELYQKFIQALLDFGSSGGKR